MAFPLGFSLRVADLRRFDSVALLHDLREKEPITWFEELGVWLLTSKALVDEVLLAPDRFVVDVDSNPQTAVLGRMMLTVDGAEHKRHRDLFAERFKHRRVHEAFTELVERHVDSLLAGFEQDGETDLAPSFANPFAVGMAGDVLGVGFDRKREIHRIYGLFAAGLADPRDPVALERATGAGDELGELLAPEIDRALAAPSDSLLSVAARSSESAEELLANLRVILFGAIETVESMILNTTWALLENPDQLELAQRDPDLWTAAVQESLRWVSPVGYLDRWAAEDTDLGGVKVSAGDYVMASIPAANRDPAAFSDPDSFDLRRTNGRQNLSFGKGIHMCLGVNLARLQGALAVRSLFERLPNLRLDETKPSSPTGFSFRRPSELHVSWDVATERT